VNHVYAVLLCLVPCVDVFMSLLAKCFDIDRYICLFFFLMLYMDIDLTYVNVLSA
jgi:hypothetical protein